ncbi:hypothetical protein E2562_015264 [Oryza meyeriana var. granulata]|uniref:Wall-associated receptor kinase galacturonan-binding domain-containing protein n=1 Tax=Oryza meyeriana var. granulata TaxID=110450 RepID=A0A6G1DLH8_9ORYZ|nr:hypothetical protein E2562_015264 [Oryza meyeriana var. granulata]
MASTSSYVVAVTLLAIVHPAVAAASGVGQQTSPARCPSACGAVDIPYPFGVGAYCSRDGFQIDCIGGATPVLAGTGDLVQYDHKFHYNFSPCSYSFLVDRDSYTFRRGDLRMEFNRTMPVWLDWAIRPNGSSPFTCADAVKDGSSYACKSRNSSCTDASNGPGYTCGCSPGFEGNAYIVGGCTEEKVRELYVRNGGLVLENVNTIRIFRKEEIDHMTRNYITALGKRCFGEVYMGTIDNNQQVAVKRCIAIDNDATDQFANEEASMMSFTAAITTQGIFSH